LRIERLGKFRKSLRKGEMKSGSKRKTLQRGCKARGRREEEGRPRVEDVPDAGRSFGISNESQSSKTKWTKKERLSVTLEPSIRRRPGHGKIREGFRRKGNTPSLHSRRREKRRSGRMSSRVRKQDPAQRIKQKKKSN